MKPLQMLDHVMLWIARVMALTLCLALAWMIYLTLFPGSPLWTNPLWRACGRYLLFAGSIASLICLFQLQFKSLRLYLVAFSILFLCVIVVAAIVDQVDFHNQFQRDEPLDFRYFWNSAISEITYPLFLPIIAPFAIFWAALRPPKYSTRLTQN
jgi:hypothetical protein